MGQELQCNISQYNKNKYYEQGKFILKAHYLESFTVKHAVHSPQRKTEESLDQFDR